LGIIVAYADIICAMNILSIFKLLLLIFYAMFDHLIYLKKLKVTIYFVIICFITKNEI
jgi:hypothetical protein